MSRARTNANNWAADITAVTAGTGITITNGTGPIPTVAVDSTVATLDGSQTLTNKTLTAPVVVLATNAQVANYTLALSDSGRIVEINNAGATTLTVPVDASVNFPVGSQINIIQTGAGQITVGGAGVTINATPGLRLRAQWSSATLIKRGTNLWVLVGDLSV